MRNITLTVCQRKEQHEVLYAIIQISTYYFYTVGPKKLCASGEKVEFYMFMEYLATCSKCQMFLAKCIFTNTT